MAAVKRKCVREPEVDSPEAGAAGLGGAKRRRVEFEDVTIYSFDRRQGDTCVPSQVSSVSTATQSWYELTTSCALLNRRP